MRIRISQKQLVLNHLKEGKKITQRAAIINYNIIRLSAIIYTLRDEGYNIKTTLKTGLYGGVYAEYKLKKKND